MSYSMYMADKYGRHEQKFWTLLSFTWARVSKRCFYDVIFIQGIRQIHNQFVQLESSSSCSRKLVSSSGFLFPSLARPWKRMSCCWFSCGYYWSCWLSCWFSHWFSWLFGCWFNCCFRLVSFAIKNFCKVFKHEFGRIYSSIMNLSFKNIFLFSKYRSI